MSKCHSMDSYCKKYLSLTSNKKMIDFCNEEGLNYESFRSAKRRYLNNLSKSSVKLEQLSPVVFTSNTPLDLISNASADIISESILEDIIISYPNGVSLNLSSADLISISKLINISLL